MQLKLYGTGESEQKQLNSQVETAKEKEKALRGRGKVRVMGGKIQGSCLPIREIKTNRRRRLPCNCTICTISKVTQHSTGHSKYQDTRTEQDTLGEPAHQTKPKPNPTELN